MATHVSNQSSQPPRGGIRWKIVIPVVLLVLLAILVALVILNINPIIAWIDGALKFLFNYETRVDPSQIIDCRTNSGCSTIHAIIASALILFVVVTGFAYTTLLERVLIARLQQRTGPNRVGPWGLLQPAADGVKLIFKEDIMPAGAFTAIYRLAPLLKVVPTLIVIAVIPWGPDITVPWFDGNWYRVPLGIADPNVGVLWILAITSIGTYGVVLAGWASNNKYAILGGMRATAQMLSYELSLGLTMAVPILLVSSMSIGDIIRQQTYIYEWFIFQNPLAAGILFIALLAEVNRAPFDLPEAEQELTAGFMTEYSGMKFATFMMGEYLGMIGISFIFASLYLGGYQDGFGLVNSLPILGPLVLIGKTVLMLMVMIWIRATLPRIRYDRLMTFGWKVLLPLALLAVGWTAIAITVGDLSGSPIVYGIVAGIIFVVVIAIGWFLLGRPGRVEAAEEDEVFEDDPIITGDAKGIGPLAVQVVGGLLAAPFAIYEWTLKQLDRLAALTPEETPPPNTEERAIEPTQPTQQGIQETGAD